MSCFLPDDSTHRKGKANVKHNFIHLQVETKAENMILFLNN
jgi:hypothetical protein